MKASLIPLVEKCCGSGSVLISFILHFGSGSVLMKRIRIRLRPYKKPAKSQRKITHYKKIFFALYTKKSLKNFFSFELILSTFIPGMRIRHFYPRIRIRLSWKNISDQAPDLAPDPAPNLAPDPT